ncbi:hypothetical protein [Marinobacter sp.]|uniref:hypothetical protein n=1 Tax=Marinobacter sp. TaxID=50741 RepID=UPI00384DEB05
MQISSEESHSGIDQLMERERLPDAYRAVVDEHIKPLARTLAGWQHRLGRPLIAGLHGAQGTGKSTLSLFLQTLLNENHDLPCAVLSLDDIYLTRAEREGLAQNVHPLLLTRGVPGTHDLLLGQQTIDHLLTADRDSLTPLPTFDKASDDRLPRSSWPLFRGGAKVVLIEGWCVGAGPDRDSERLASPVNSLEAREDPEGIWRQFVNDQLWGAYAWFFDQIDRLIMLKAPSMDCVVRWRTLQEHRLAERATTAPSEGSASQRIMSDRELLRFIMHYERITRRCLADLPARADVVLEVDKDHRFARQYQNHQDEGDWLL